MSAEQRAAVARIVAEHWRDQVMAPGLRSREVRIRFVGHALALVLAALDGETDPAQLGINDGHVDAQRVREAAR